MKLAATVKARLNDHVSELNELLSSAPDSESGGLVERDSVTTLLTRQAKCYRVITI